MIIRNRWTNGALWEGDSGTIKDALIAALAADADLAGANLRGANLRGADLTGANLTGANLVICRDDIWAVLSGAPAEVPTLLAKLRAGEIDGTCYEGACACLIGTIANARHCHYTELATITPDSERPAERFFAAISKGDTPETSQPVKIAEGWIVDWLIRMQAAFGSTVTVD